MDKPDTAYREFHGTLRRYLARRLGKPEDVEDVLQDVFLRVSKNSAALESASNPLAWLYTITRNAMIDHLRRQARHAALDCDEMAENIAHVAAEAPDNEFSHCLVPLVGNLPEIYRDAVRFVDMAGGRQTDFAAARGMSVSTAKSRVQRGRGKLKAAIQTCCAVERDALDRVTGLACEPPDHECC